MPGYERKKDAILIEPNDVVQWNGWKCVIAALNETVLGVEYTKLYFEDGSSEHFHIYERLEVC
jgi:hypothetical protein